MSTSSLTCWIWPYALLVKMIFLKWLFFKNLRPILVKHRCLLHPHFLGLGDRVQHSSFCDFCFLVIFLEPADLLVRKKHHRWPVPVLTGGGDHRSPSRTSSPVVPISVCTVSHDWRISQETLKYPVQSGTTWSFRKLLLVFLPPHPRLCRCTLVPLTCRLLTRLTLRQRVGRHPLSLPLLLYRARRNRGSHNPRGPTCQHTTEIRTRDEDTRYPAPMKRGKGITVNSFQVQEVNNRCVSTRTRV